MGPTELPAGVTLQGEAVVLQDPQHTLGIYPWKILAMQAAVQ
jgi:hypothetical protein